MRISKIKWSWGFQKDSHWTFPIPDKFLGYQCWIKLGFVGITWFRKEKTDEKN